MILRNIVFNKYVSVWFYSFRGKILMFLVLIFRKIDVNFMNSWMFSVFLRVLKLVY